MDELGSKLGFWLVGLGAIAFYTNLMLLIMTQAFVTVKRPLRFQEWLFRRSVRARIRKLELPPNRELEKILIRTRAGMLWALLMMTPPAVMLFGYFLVVLPSFISGGSLIDADSATTRYLLGLLLFASAFAAAVIFYRVYHTRMHSDDYVVLGAVHLATHADQGKRGAGWERLQPMMWQLEALERDLAIFFSQRAGATDAQTASQFRQRWAGAVSLTRDLKLRVFEGRLDVQKEARELALHFIVVFSQAKFDLIPNGDVELVQDVDARLSPRIKTVSLGALLLLVCTALFLLSDSLVPVIAPIVAAALYLLSMSFKWQLGKQLTGQAWPSRAASLGTGGASDSPLPISPSTGGQGVGSRHGVLRRLLGGKRAQDG